MDESLKLLPMVETLDLSQKHFEKNYQFAKVYVIKVFRLWI